MNIYIYPEFAPDYYDGLAFAIAESEDEAKKMILDEMDLHPANAPEFGQVIIKDLDQKIAYAVKGGM